MQTKPEITFECSFMFFFKNSGFRTQYYAIKDPIRHTKFRKISSGRFFVNFHSILTRIESRSEEILRNFFLSLRN